MPLRKKVLSFFFASVSGCGFGLMRISWASITFLSFLFQGKDVIRYYSDNGFLPTSLAPLVTRSAYHFSVLTWMTSPWLVYGLWALLLVSLLAAAVGWRTRWAVGISFLLMLSFYERNNFLVTGGELVLRQLGFILLIAPGINSFSFDRRRHGEPQISRMPMWPYRMLLWQTIVMYGMSVWYQKLGVTWWQGTAMILVFQHPFVGLWAGTRFFNSLAAVSQPIGYGLWLWKLGWILLLVPASWFQKIVRRGPTLKQWLLIVGILFHGSSLVLLDLGSFSAAILSGYWGLLTDEDFAAINSWVRAATNWKQAARSDSPDIS